MSPRNSNGMPAKVMFVTHSAEWIGPNVSLLELLIRLPEDLRAVVAVPGQGRLTTALEEHGVPFVSLTRLDKYGIPALARAVWKERVSLVYGNSAHGVSRNALVAAKICGLPFVYHLREIARPNRRHSVSRLFSWADAAIAVSRATAESYRDSFRKAPHVIYNGVAADQFNLDRVTCRGEVAAEFGLEKDSPIVVQVGNISKRKGQRRAVEALPELLPIFPECRLLMIGRLDRDPDYVRDLRAYIREHGLEHGAIMTGLRTDVPRLLAASDVFLHTAREDPHPRAVIEAMAAGLPVVAVAADGVTETVVDHETGFLVSRPSDGSSLAEPVARLLENPELRRAMGRRGRERARRVFSASRTAQEVVDVIRGVLGRR